MDPFPPVAFKTAEVKMRRSPGVFNTDRVNLARMRIPASELMKSEEEHQRECVRGRVGPGMPVHMQHDMHRLIGRSRPLGLYADSEMVRQLGLIEEPETENEKADLQEYAAAYWEQYHREGAEPYRDELIARVAPADVGNGRFLRMEAVVMERPGIAAELYPDLFTPGSPSVDKDGLVDYHNLIARMTQLQPGVFHDSERNLLLLAHRFFRRSLSRRNKFNDYFLQSFEATAFGSSDLSARLRLDPNVLGHPASARNFFELEHWRGPIYNDDIATIPSGVAEHKADDRTRLYEGVDRTQVWWKAPESRVVAGQAIDYRTFEIEELIENPSGGLADNHFGCRYAHAEFSSDEAAITHFDGAIRGYAGEAYLERIETSIDRAGKYADYTKLFRFDGALPIPQWKRLLSDFFRGNKLVPEYLGAPAEVVEREKSDFSPDILVPTHEVALAALISLEPGSFASPMEIYAELCQEIGGEIIPYVEVGVGQVEKYIRARLDLSDITTVGIRDDILNLSRIGFGASSDLKKIFDVEMSALATALRHDAESGLVRRAAIPLAWDDRGLVVTLTIAGDANKVATVIHHLPAVIDPTQPASEWIEELSELIKATTPRQRSSVIWDGVYRGVLAIRRTGTVEEQMQIPEVLMQRLSSSGKLNVSNAELASVL
jgi:hypothetical protein